MIWSVAVSLSCKHALPEARVQGVTQRVSLLPLWGREEGIMSVVREVPALSECSRVSKIHLDLNSSLQQEPAVE